MGCAFGVEARARSENVPFLPVPGVASRSHKTATHSPVYSADCVDRRPPIFPFARATSACPFLSDKNAIFEYDKRPLEPTRSRRLEVRGIPHGHIT